MRPLARCHLCRAREGIAEDPANPGVWWCTDTPECNFRARLRIHVRRDEALRLRDLERLELDRQGQYGRNARGDALVPAPRPGGPDHKATERPPRTGIRTLVALLRQDRMMSRKEAERRLGHAIDCREWTDAHVAYYKAIGRRDLAWTARR